MIFPVLHRIVVRPDNIENVDPIYKAARLAGIDIPEPKREQAAVDRGVVVAIGATAFKDFGSESPIEVGDFIAYAKYGGKAIKDPYTDEEVVCLNDEDIICIFKKEPLDG